MSDDKLLLGYITERDVSTDKGDFQFRSVNLWIKEPDDRQKIAQMIMEGKGVQINLNMYKDRFPATKKNGTEIPNLYNIGKATFYEPKETKPF